MNGMHTLKWFFYCRLQGIVIVGNLNLILDPLQWEIIVNDALIAYVLEFFCDFGCPWVCFEHCTVDRGRVAKFVGGIGECLKEDIGQCCPHGAARLTMVGVPRRQVSRRDDIF
jgi:hypothetical protein